MTITSSGRAYTDGTKSPPAPIKAAFSYEDFA